MRIISFGDLYLDYYMKESKVFGISGGKSNANILANLADNFDTAFIGVVGNDIKGNIAIKSLSDLGVDISNIKKVDGETKTLFIMKNEYDKVCPYCHREVGYIGTKIDEEYVINKIKEDDVIIVDNLNDSTLNILKKVHNQAFINISYLGSFMYNSLEELKELSGIFTIINMNEKVYHILKRKFGIDSNDLYSILKPKILIITRGKKGTDIIVDDILEQKVIEEPVREVDDSGEIDAFFATLISEYLMNPEIDEKWISKTYMKARIKAARVVSSIGARSHIIPLYKMKDYKECICKEIEIL